MREMKRVILAAAAAFTMLVAPANAALLQTRIEQGRLAGADHRGVAAYLGIPYAAPPVGQNRWRAPQPAPKWKGLRKAESFGAACYQNDGPQARNMPPYTPEYMIAAPISEDCLYLNIWTPANRPSDKLPVLVWIHGGGFAIGGGDVPIYDGRNLAEHGIVVVSINYRLGYFGFFAHPELSAEAGSSGNYGLLDMIAGLKWVQENISAFGGDPSHVTIAGQSAGAVAVHNLILSPLAKGLFHQAIAQSGSGMGINPENKKDAEQSGREAAEKRGWRSLADLRKLSPADVHTGLIGAKRAPVADGTVLPLDVPGALAAGRYNDTPILTGYTADEGSAWPGYFPASVEAFATQVKERYGSLADQILALYPLSDFLNSSLSFGRDRTLAAMILWSEQRRQTSRFPIYGYLFSHIEPGPDSAKYRAFHSSEIPYVFGTLDKTPARGFTEIDKIISDTMQTYWVNFVRTGNPNGPAATQWPQLDQRFLIMEINSETKPRAALSPEQLDLFRRYRDSGGTLGIR